MSNFKFKPDVEFDPEVSFYRTLNVKLSSKIDSKQDRFLTYIQILNFLSQTDNKLLFTYIRKEIKNGSRPLDIFYRIIVEDENADLSFFKEAIEYYFDIDLMERFK